MYNITGSVCKTAGARKAARKTVYGKQAGFFLPERAADGAYAGLELRNWNRRFGLNEDCCFGKEQRRA